jgi:methionyl-tRNA formyltransferase
MRVVFMGTPEFAVVSLHKLLAAGVNIVGVVTTPDKPKGRGQKLQSSPVKMAAESAGLTVLQPESLVATQCIVSLQELKPDLIVVVAFKILPEDVFTIPPLGTINLHGSLLPKYRGAAPINWAIINGETETGVTTFFIQKQVDTGNMIAQAKIPITSDMTAGELHDIMAQTGADLLLKTIQSVEDKTYTLTTQDESQVTKAPKIHKADCEIDFNQPAQQVHDFIRGLSPYPGAYSFIDGKIIKLFGSNLLDTDNWQLNTEKKVAPGTRLKAQGSELYVACKSGIISIGEVQLEGKRRMSVEEFLRGYAISRGTRFGQVK